MDEGKMMPPSVLLVFLCILVSETGRGIVVPSIAYSIFYQGGTVEDVGTAISLFSLGRLLSV